MAQSKSRKLVTGTISAAVIASALAPVAASASVKVPNVKSATPLNAKQIKVVFDNGKTATITLPYSFKDGSTVTSFTYAGHYYKSVKLTTPYAPGVKTVTATGAKQIKVVFTDGVTKVINLPYNFKAGSTVTSFTYFGHSYKSVKLSTPYVANVKLATVLSEKSIKVLFDNGESATITLPYRFKDGSNVASFTYAGHYYSQVKLSAPYIAAPAVSSVSAINGTQLLVKFNKTVDTTTGGNKSNYILSDTSNSQGVASATVQADGKSVLLTLKNAYDNTAAHNIAVTVNGVATADDTSVFFPLYTSTVSINDTTAPTVSSVQSVTNGATAANATVTFSEPVSSGYVIVDGGTKYAVTAGSDTTVLSGLSLDSSKSHTIEVVNLKDTAGNITSDATSNFSVTKDAVAPVISSVSAYNDNQLLVTFNKKMPTDVNGNLVDLNNNLLAGNFSVKDESLAPLGTATTVTAVPDDTTGTKFVVDFGANASTFYANSTTRNLQLVVSGTNLTDTLGNAFTTTVKSVSLSQDTVAPAVTNVTVEKDSNGNATSFTFHYNKTVGSLTGKVSIVDANGVQQADATPQLGADNKSVVVPVSGLTGTVSVSYAKGLVSDTALTPNLTAAYNGTVDLGKPASPTVKYNVSSVSASGNKITVTFPKTVKGGNSVDSATNPANYTLGGKALPAGTTITLNAANVPAPLTVAQTIATITLPAGSVTSDTTSTVINVNAGIAGLDGSVSNAYTDTIALTDNTAPVLQSARLVSTTGTSTVLELTYSEAMNQGLAASNVLDELQFTDNGAVVGATATADTVKGFTNKVLVTLATSAAVKTTDTLTVKTTPVATGGTADLVDNSTGANAEVTGTTVTVQ